MLWINFLHLYQPANIDSYNIKLALNKSYYRLLRLMEENSALKMTWNISGCLLARLKVEGENDFLTRLQALVKTGRLELTSSAAYHGFLPLLTKNEIVRQIKENEKILKDFFGANFKPAGFFLPEMAYSSAVAKIIKSLGYKWLIVDELAFAGGKKRPDFRKYYLDVASGLKIVFRNRVFSSSYPPHNLFKLLKKENKEEQVIITATDAELYGLRHEDPTAEIEKIVKKTNLKTKTISEFINEQETVKLKAEKIKLVACSWESSRQEVSGGQPFALWSGRNNKIHKLLWRLTYLALDLGEKYKRDKNYKWYRWHLVRGIASCTFWWASAHDFSKIFGPFAWSPDGIERGLEDLIRSVRSFNSLKTKKDKLKAENYYLKIKKLIWEEHWRKHWQKNA